MEKNKEINFVLEIIYRTLKCCVCAKPNKSNYQGIKQKCKQKKN